MAPKVEWSRRLRAAGLWHLCPLVANAQDPSLPMLWRALAAGAAWAGDRDCQARAVLRMALPHLSPEELAVVNGHVPVAALAELGRGPFVWSVVPFFNELDVLEARLTEMARVVDHFVVVEATSTHRGEPKPLYFQQAASRFSRWSEQIHYRVVDLPSGPVGPADDVRALPEWERDRPTDWVRERYQRDVAHRFLGELGAASDDLVLLTDLDEIVRADAVNRVMAATGRGPAVMAMEHYRYSPRWRVPGQWYHPKAFRYGQVEASYSTIRHQAYPVVPDTGWHLSYFGGIAMVDRKLGAVALHAKDDDRPEMHDPLYLADVLGNGLDFAGQKVQPSSGYLPSSLSLLFEHEDLQ